LCRIEPVPRPGRRKRKTRRDDKKDVKRKDNKINEMLRRRGCGRREVIIVVKINASLSLG
jgi:hypothetical protein